MIVQKIAKTTYNTAITRLTILFMEVFKVNKVKKYRVRMSHAKTMSVNIKAI